MSSDTAPEWYLEIAGKRTGPFSVEQVQGLLRESQISSDTRISGRGLRGPVVVGEFLAAIELRKKSGAVAQGRGASFSPPPRPDGIEERRARSPEAIERTRVGFDPAQDLFDALQQVRERQNLQQQRKLQPLSEDDPGAARAVRIPPQAILTAALALILIVAVWGLTRLTSSPAPGTDLLQASRGGPKEGTASPAGSGPAPASAPAAAVAPLTPAKPNLNLFGNVQVKPRTVLSPQILNNQAPPLRRNEVDRDIEPNRIFENRNPEPIEDRAMDAPIQPAEPAQANLDGAANGENAPQNGVQDGQNPPGDGGAPQPVD